MVSEHLKGMEIDSDLGHTEPDWLFVGLGLATLPSIVEVKALTPSAIRLTRSRSDRKNVWRLLISCLMLLRVSSSAWVYMSLICWMAASMVVAVLA